MDCEGLTPFRFPLQMMRSCAVLLQDYYPNRLAALFVVRLPPIARMIAMTLFQVIVFNVGLAVSFHASV